MRIRKSILTEIERYYYLIGITLTIALTGCESFIITEPPSNNINGENVFNSDGTAIAAVTEQYGKLVSLANNSSITLTSGLSADELTLFNGVTNNLLSIYKNDQRSNASGFVGATVWSSLYERILSVNASVEGLTATKSLYGGTKEQLLGECYFLRAFYYFYLTNLYGDVPLALTSDPNINNNLDRTPRTQIYQQIVLDLKNAQQLLNPNYVNKDMIPYSSNAERIRPNKGTATALLARVYLYMGNHFNDAEAAATDLINQTSLYGLQPLNDVFLKNSKEAIWQLQPVQSGRNTNDGFMFILPASGPNVSANPVYLTKAQVNSFETSDARGSIGTWVNRVTTTGGMTYYYPFKYKSKAATVTEYSMVLRLAEQYLIRAEARLMQGKLIGPNSATSDINIIRQRAGLLPTTEVTQTGLADAILKERRSELFAEWGHRWLDLKRTNKIDQVMTIEAVEKASSWKSYQQLYPIPFTDIQRGPNLRQNLGY